MPLYVRDENIDKMLVEIQKLTGATKTEAVKTALAALLRRAKAQKSPSERLMPVIEAARNLPGKKDPNFDMKKFSDEMWDDQ
ncbi:hypothetical protein MXMO3_03472 (plasmid) [Maritalea myrionectae]|uniref:Antitoxin VapB n=2 Tax=Maritalea myrionectae TaxID=454601 RepID=A0A2R4MIZ2_9HYPH|nr:hypothetical protein MXMO3_03472 [Maritalea myrionectae]